MAKFLQTIRDWLLRPLHSQPARKPNILFIMADQFRADALGGIGGWTKTPNLDALAARGAVFTNVFANSAECIPSRLSLATGLYPHQTGIDRNTSCTLNPDFPNWMQAIEAAGYQTSLFGKTHLHPHEGDLRDRLPLMHRYGLQIVDETTGPRAAAHVRSNMTDLWTAAEMWDAYRSDLDARFSGKAFEARPSALPLELYYDSYVGRTAREYLVTVGTERPWFCWMSFGGPHEPWDAPEPYASMYRAEDMPPPIPRMAGYQKPGLLGKRYDSASYSPDMTPDEIAAMRANYAGNVTLIDDEIGKALATIEARGEMDNTLVVVTSDHGEMNGDHGLIYKANFLDPAIKVPLIIAPPPLDRVAGGIIDTGLAELMDVGATIVDYAGASLPPTFGGRSLRARVAGKSEAPREAAISEFGGHACVIRADIKAEFDPELDCVLAFDRGIDADEQEDVSSDPRYRDRIDSMRQWYLGVRAATPPAPAVLA